MDTPYKGLYLTVFVLVFGGALLLIFLQLSGFRIKLSSIFVSAEFGPSQPEITEGNWGNSLDKQRILFSSVLLN